ncbi:hypothetical protein STEG23_002444, partial [Scotinomys teguina]
MDSSVQVHPHLALKLGISLGIHGERLVFRSYEKPEEAGFKICEGIGSGSNGQGTLPVLHCFLHLFNCLFLAFFKEKCTWFLTVTRRLQSRASSSGAVCCAVLCEKEQFAKPSLFLISPGSLLEDGTLHVSIQRKLLHKIYIEPTPDISSVPVVNAYMNYCKVFYFVHSVPKP